MSTILRATADAVWERLKQNPFGLGTSEGVAFSNAFFARDALINAYCMVRREPEMARKVILSCARLQGTKFDARRWGGTEEEPGKIHHEYHPLTNPTIDQRVWSRMWGGDKTGWTVWMADDTTALFLRLVEAFIHRYGDDILDARVTRNDGVTVSVEACCLDAGEWLKEIVLRHRGVFALSRRNPLGLFHHSWKDSPLSYPYADGRQAGYTRLIAYVEIQAWVIDALHFVNEMAGRLTYEPAIEAAEAALSHFQDVAGGFVPAIELVNKQWRKVDVQGSSQGWLLDTGLFDRMSALTRHTELVGIVERLFAPDMMTPVGLRCRSLKTGDAVPVIDYHGEWTVWPIDNFITARGLERQGFSRLAAVLDQCNMMGLMTTRRLDEYFMVTPEGRLIPDPAKAISKTGFKTTRLPEANQAWTAMVMLSTDPDREYPLIRRWQAEVEEGILGRIDRPFKIAGPDVKLCPLGDIPSLVRYVPGRYLASR